MYEQQPEAIQRKVKLLAAESLRQSDPSGWFEVLYTEANDNAEQVPWARLSIHPYLQDWLDCYTVSGDAPSALVIGCGLGDDAEALAQWGFKVTAFDISPTAIAWCQKRFPDSSVTYLVADLFALDPSWHRAFDFVFESRNIQALPLSVRPKAIKSIGQLVAVGGTLLVITRVRETEAEPDGPPWPLSDFELAQFQELGLKEIRRDTFFDGDNDSVKKLRIEYLAVETPHA
ncbi:MAG: class I SAM-dependent methyltransferase [Xenococcaceae cyanobacterium]